MLTYGSVMHAKLTSGVNQMFSYSSAMQMCGAFNSYFLIYEYAQFINNVL